MIISCRLELSPQLASRAQEVKFNVLHHEAEMWRQNCSVRPTQEAPAKKIRRKTVDILSSFGEKYLGNYTCRADTLTESVAIHPSDRPCGSDQRMRRPPATHTITRPRVLLFIRDDVTESLHLSPVPPSPLSSPPDHSSSLVSTLTTRSAGAILPSPAFESRVGI